MDLVGVLFLGNPFLLIQQIGEDWPKNLSQLAKLKTLINNPSFVRRVGQVKQVSFNLLNSTVKDFVKLLFSLLIKTITAGK